MELTIKGADGIRAAAKTFVRNMPRCSVFAFYGEMGAGKTTFIKAICRELGVSDAVTSPTFAIINEYSSERTCDPIYHFDFYRVKRIEEAYDMGCEEYFYSGALCFIEWPEIIESLLPADAARVTIEEMADGSRRVAIV